MPRLRHIEDAHILRAMAHPLRLRLIGALRKDGPATASELARRLGESSGSTSYHLRQLARFGFVEEAAERNRGRTKHWRAVDAGTEWSIDTDDAGLVEASSVLAASWSPNTRGGCCAGSRTRPSGTGAGGRPRRGSTNGSS